MYLLVLSIWVAVTANGHSAKLPLNSLRGNRLMSNTLNPNDGERYYKPREWVKIISQPLAVLNHAAGTYVELECVAIGSPSPRIQWLKGNTPITEDEDYASNSITTNFGIGKLESRLVIGNVLPIHEGMFTCLAESGEQTTAATTTLYVSPGNSAVGHNFSDFLGTNMVPAARARVRIVLFNTAVMEVIGSNIILPCKTIGSPKPGVLWVDNNEQIVNNQNNRMKVLPDGELSIENLHWGDMGGFTCIARNSYSKDSITTFVYPMLSNN